VNGSDPPMSDDDFKALWERTRREGEHGRYDRVFGEGDRWFVTNDGCDHGEPRVGPFPDERTAAKALLVGEIGYWLSLRGCREAATMFHFFFPRTEGPPLKSSSCTVCYGKPAS
jgi:hypothetical protein